MIRASDMSIGRGPGGTMHPHNHALHNAQIGAYVHRLLAFNFRYLSRELVGTRRSMHEVISLVSLDVLELAVARR